MTYTIEVEADGFLVRYADFLPPHEVFAVLRFVAGHPLAQRACYMLCDFTEVNRDTELAMSISDEREVAARVHEIVGGNGAALLMAAIVTAPLVRAFIRTVWRHGAHPPQHRLGTFETEAAARRWIAAEMSPVK